MLKGSGKPTGRNRPERHDGRNVDQTDMAMSGDNSSKNDQPHLRRILNVSVETIAEACKEIEKLGILGKNKTTRNIRILVKTVKAHLPDAKIELQLLDVQSTNWKDPVQYKDAYETIRLDYKNMLIHAQCHVKEKQEHKDELVQGNTYSKGHFVFKTRKEHDEQDSYRTSVKEMEECKKLRMDVYQLREEKKALEKELNHFREYALIKEQELKKISLQNNSQQDANYMPEQENKQISILRQAVYNYISEKKRMQEEMEQYQTRAEKLKEENQKLLTKIQKQNSELAKCKSESEAQHKKLESELDRIIHDKEKLPEKVKLQKQNESRHNEYHQSDLNEKNNELQIELDEMFHKYSKISEQLNFEKEIANIKDAKYKQMETLVKSQEQDITNLKELIEIRCKELETNERQKQENLQILKENDTIKKNLKREKENLKMKVREIDQLSLELKELRHCCSKEIKSPQVFLDLQLSQSDIQHQDEVDRTQQNINKDGVESLLKNENKRENGEEKTRHIKHHCSQKLQMKIDQLESLNKTLQEKLNLEKENAKAKKEQYKTSALQNAQMRDKLNSETENCKKLSLIQQQLIKKNHTLKEDIYKLHQDNNKLTETLKEAKNSEKNSEKELDLTRLNLQKLSETHLKEMTKLKAAGDKQTQLIDENQQMRLEMDKLLQELLKTKNDLMDAGESYKKREKHIMSSLNEEIQKLRNEVDQLLDEKEKQMQELALSKQKLTKEEQDHAQKLQEFKERQEQEIKILKETFERKIEKELLYVKENASKLEENTISSLNDQIQKLKKEVDQMHNEKKRMLQENASMQEHYSKSDVSLKHIIEKQNNEIFNLKSENRRLDEAVRKRSRDVRLVETNDSENKLQQQLATVREQLKNARQELDDTKSRLSRAMGDKLTDNNPNIADLSDRNRPTKLSERYQELYDNQWTDAFELVEGTIRNEEKTIELLVEILMEIMRFCKAASVDQMTAITEILSKGQELHSSTIKQIKDLRKSSAENYGKGLYTDYLKILNESKSTNAKMALKIPQFVMECFEICWLMTVQDPPVVLGPEIRRDTPFNKDHYKAYTKSGNRLDYIVWPVLLLQQDGPVLCKGVAQGY